VSRIGIIAAMPREVAPLVKGWQRDDSRRVSKVPVWESERAVVVCAGMGEERAALGVEAAISRGASELWSVGWAGALDESLHVGEVLQPALVVDARTGERYACAGGQGVLVTTATVAGVVEKKRLRAAYAADLVDMEAATVARLAAARGLKFRAVKAVSDEVGFEMKDLGRFSTADGQFREAGFALFAALRPWMWPRVARMADASARAAKALCADIMKDLKAEA